MNTTRVAYVGWWLALGLLTYGLLSPTPPKVGAALLPSHWTFWASKGVHLGAFAFLAATVGFLCITPRHRRRLWTTLVVYAALTEFLQTFVEGRYGCFADVCINWTGITLGLGLVRGWRLISSARGRQPISATTTAT